MDNLLATKAVGGKPDELGGGERADLTFEKDLTVAVEIAGEERITMMELLRGIKEVCGLVCGCRFKDPKRYEVTMSSLRGKEKLVDGFKIRGCNIFAKDLSMDEMVVSFLNLPVYIADGVIVERLTTWGVEAASPVKRRFWPGTRIADGTRFLKVKFNDTVRSLPYSTRFATMEGMEYFRVIHDRQVKVCRLCIQPGHVLRDCPDFACYKCGGQGHYARECESGGDRGCAGCGRDIRQCVCSQAGGPAGADHPSDEGTGVVEETELEESGSEEALEDDVSEEEHMEPESGQEPGVVGEDIGASLDSVLLGNEEEPDDAGTEVRREGKVTRPGVSAAAGTRFFGGAISVGGDKRKGSREEPSGEGSSNGVLGSGNGEQVGGKKPLPARKKKQRKDKSSER